MSGLVFMCSGQGSQAPGMGASLLGDATVDQVFSCASEVFGKDIVRLCSQAEAEELKDTRNAQAAIVTLSVAIGRALEQRGIAPDYLLGFSLGQTSALALSGMLTDAEAFALVDARAKAMARAAERNPGAMSALLKAQPEEVQALCGECSCGEVLVAANYNCPGQIVISGTVSAIERAEDAWAQRKGRFSRLATAGAFHSPLMEPAREQLAAFLDTLDFKQPRIPVICNTDAQPVDVETVRTRLLSHLTSPVLFEQSVQALASRGANRFVEIGYGGVLAGLVRRIDKTLERAVVCDRASFDEFAQNRGTGD